jgi:hypothetical protein
MHRLSHAFVTAVLVMSWPAVGQSEPHAPLVWHAEPVTEVPRRDAVSGASEANGAAAGVEDAQLMPFTNAASAVRGHAQVSALGGYDSASGTGRARSVAEVKTWDFLTLRLDYEHGPGTGSDDRIAVGARAAILEQAKHGVDLGAGFSFQPKDFRGEGDFIGSVLFGRHFGRLGVFGNAMVGMDGEGDDQSLELRLSSLYRLGAHLHVGVDARGRHNLSSDEKRTNAQDVQWDVEGGPLLVATVGPLALTGLIGPRMLALAEPGGSTSHTRAGVLAMAGMGAVF